MNIAKMKPCGNFSPAGLRAGVHRKTNVYIDASKRAWLAPSNATLASAKQQGTSDLQCASSHVSRTSKACCPPMKFTPHLPFAKASMRAHVD
jgi:hypothetical protein